LHRAAAELDQDPPEPVAVIVDPDAHRRTYGELVERIRVKVTAITASGSVVAVVSRGDTPLLHLPGLTGWHFPKNELGMWAGFHPADGQHAIELVEDVRAQGAQYLLIPATGFWWLDFYEPLRQYLHSECTVIVDDA